jgi:hypothetical protein
MMRRSETGSAGKKLGGNRSGIVGGGESAESKTAAKNKARRDRKKKAEADAKEAEEAATAKEAADKASKGMWIVY